MLTKAAVHFEHPAKGKDHCSGCVHFALRGQESCAIVAGRIEPGDWCERFQRRSAMPVAPGKAGVKSEMAKFKAGTLHSGSPKGPVVKNPKQAIAISLNEAGLSKKKKGFRI